MKKLNLIISKISRNEEFIYSLKEGGISKIDDLNTFSEQITLETHVQCCLSMLEIRKGYSAKIMHATISSEIIKFTLHLQVCLM